jgi:hypothetical protein
MKLPITQRGWKVQGRVNMFIGYHKATDSTVTGINLMALLDNINSRPCPACKGDCHVIDNGLKCPSCSGSPL